MDIVQINIRKLDATLLLVLVELVRHRRTTVVARRLGLSQSAVSHALKRLRLLFDEPLFLRRADGLTPTARALDLAPRAEAVLVQMGGLLAPAAFDPHTATHGFTLASNDLFALLVGAPLTVDIAARAPKVSLTAQSASATLPSPASPAATPIWRSAVSIGRPPTSSPCLCSRKPLSPSRAPTIRTFATGSTSPASSHWITCWCRSSAALPGLSIPNWRRLA